MSGSAAISTADRWRLLGLLVVVAVLGSVLLTRRRNATGDAVPPSTNAPANPSTGAALAPGILQEFTALEESEREADRTVWSVERRAEQHALRVERLWESLNASPEGLALLQDLQVRLLTRVDLAGPEALPHGIQRWRSAAGSPRIGWDGWRESIGDWRSKGWRLVQSEWRHVRFVPAAAPAPDASEFEVRLDVSRSTPPERAQVLAVVRIEWPESDTSESMGDVHLDSVEILRRAGRPLFEPTFDRAIAPFPRTSWIDPVLVRDLDGDGIPEIILAARNLVLWRNPGGTWEERPLSAHHPGLIFTALLADFTGDGIPDLLMAVRSGLVLLRGSAGGRFETPPVMAWTAPDRLQYAQAFTCGDMDGDGDLDVFLGQYRTPYQGGQMPTPYFDANDAPPAYLLRNDGHGRFEDVTAGSGLEAHRHRRSYAASLADLDGDGDLDLVVTSDFAGMEVYGGDGRGRFAERTGSWLGDARGFGMSHAFSDFNADGFLDVLLVAMPQPTASRLSALGLERPGHEAWSKERIRMTVGNRLFLGGPGGFRGGPGGRVLEDAGWAWSAAAFDLDADRFPDLHVVNGHETRRSVHDYESEFWTQDIYLPPTTKPAVADAFFASKFASTRGAGWSYGGHHKNRLLLNLAGTGFADAGHLAGVALGEDSRNVVADDFDGDGKVDLLVTTFEIWPEVRQTVRIFSNRVPDAGHWIGFHLPEVGGSPGPVGATVRIRDGRGQQARNVVAGDAYRSQSAPVVRFGLGDVDHVDSVEVRWPGGWRSVLGPDLEADRFHAVPLPRKGE